MVVELGETLISAVHNAITSGEQITNLELTSRLNEITLAHQIFKRAQCSSDIEKTLQKEDCTDNDKQLIFKLISEDRQKQSDFFDYKLNVILSNDATFKALTPKIEMRIKDQEVELSAEQFSDLRYEVARAIHRMQHYLY
ncbi:hypothetical protein M3Y97_00012100 [Aphelenchoides bicaudatus]|nr:hypothetical protein M3Y97_00012100 [Aphelenchoides bicaudatus]